MTPDFIISKAKRDGLVLEIATNHTIRVIGNQELVEKWLPTLQANKPALLNALLDDGKRKLVEEFMADGLSHDEAIALMAVAVMPKPAAEWIAMIGELDALIREYCALAALPEDIKQETLAARRSQPLSTIPAALDSFREEVARLKHGQDSSC